MSFHDFHRPVVVAMVPVHVVQAAIDQVIKMIAVGHHFMPAVGAMGVIGIASGVHRLALIWVGGIHLQYMLTVAPPIRMVQVTVLEIVDMVAVLDRGVPAVGIVLVGLATRLFHLWSPFALG